jgi:hypothetical protein
MRYLSEPMLCEYLWKEQITKGNKNSNNTSIGDDAEATTKTEEQPQANDSNDASDPDANKAFKSDEAEVGDKATKTQKEEDNYGEDPENKAVTITSTTNRTRSYDDYRASYGWKFLQHFFNHHLGTFRLSLSLSMKKVVSEKTCLTLLTLFFLLFLAPKR